MAGQTVGIGVGKKLRLWMFEVINLTIGKGISQIMFGRNIRLTGRRTQLTP